VIVILTGSREYTDRDHVRDVCEQLLTDPATPLRVRVGDCPTGLDLFVRQWCAERLPRRCWKVFEADWRRFGPRAAGSKRNEAMVDERPKADMCIGFYQPGAKNAGTHGCTLLAKKAGIEVRRYGYETPSTTDYQQETLIP
jgi:hypothetical protein